MPRISAFLAFALVGCAPQSAELSDATLTAWLNEDTSLPIFADLIDLSAENYDERWDIDCRPLEENEQFLRDDFAEADITNDLLDLCAPDDGDTDIAAEQVWLNERAWRGLQMPLDDTWRGEGIFTNEDDLHVTFHHRMPGGEDFRWVFAIDPDFNPTECVGEGDDVSAEPIDGTEWLTAWSDTWSALGDRNDLPRFLADAVERFPNGTLYPLNARSYQFDIRNLGGQANQRDWPLPEEWLSGFAQGRFVNENLRSRPGRFANEFIYSITDGGAFGLNAAVARDSVWYGDCQAEGDDPTQVCPRYNEFFSLAVEARENSRMDLNQAMPAGVSAGYEPIHFDNRWRETDDASAGLDGWQQMEYSWVVLSADSEPEVGGEVEGAFSILYDADDSQSRYLIQGFFSIPKVKRDRWGVRNLRDTTFEDGDVETPCLRNDLPRDGEPAEE
jgi:hypothetical protein